MKLNISREDFLRGKLVDPEWYSAEITGVDEDPSKKGDCTNWKVNFRILEDGPFKDVPVIKTFNEKAPGIAIPFFTAVMGVTELEPDRESTSTLPRVRSFVSTSTTSSSRIGCSMR